MPIKVRTCLGMFGGVEKCSQQHQHDQTFAVDTVIQMYDDVREQMYHRVDRPLC